MTAPQPSTPVRLHTSRVHHIQMVCIKKIWTHRRNSLFTFSSTNVQIEWHELACIHTPWVPRIHGYLYVSSWSAIWTFDERNRKSELCKWARILDAIPVNRQVDCLVIYVIYPPLLNKSDPVVSDNIVTLHLYHLLGLMIRTFSVNWTKQSSSCPLLLCLLI